MSDRVSGNNERNSPSDTRRTSGRMELLSSKQSFESIQNHPPGTEKTAGNSTAFLYPAPALLKPLPRKCSVRNLQRKFTALSASTVERSKVNTYFLLHSDARVFEACFNWDAGHRLPSAQNAVLTGHVYLSCLSNKAQLCLQVYDRS